MTEATPNESETKEIEPTHNLELKIKQLEDLKTHLNELIDMMMLNSSFLSRIASYWGKRSLWQKIILGIVLIVPLFILAVALHLPVLLTLSLFLLVIYTLSSLLLDNHERLSVQRTEKLKKEMGAVLELMNLLIVSLGKIHDQFASEVKQMQDENDLFTEYLNHFDELYKKRVEQEGSLEDSNIGLQKVHQNLEQLIGLLQTKYKEQLAEHEAKMKEAQKQFEQRQNNLVEQITELTELKEGMSQENEQLRSLSETLKQSVLSISQQLQLDEPQQEAFRAKLNEFLNDKEASYHLIAAQHTEEANKFNELYEQYKALYEEFKHLLQRDAHQIEHLEQLELFKPALHSRSAVRQRTPLGVGASPVGFFNHYEHERREEPAQQTRLGLTL